MEELKELNILYAEDDTATREGMIRILSRFFSNITSAKDGREALEQYKTKSFDLVLTDINMPNMSGLELIKHIREENSSIPVVLLTAHQESNYLLDAINLSVSGYVLKPVNAMKLMETLQKSYLPIYQQKLLEEKNKELELLNIKIKETAKKEMENLINKNQYLSDDDIDFADLIDNITL